MTQRLFAALGLAIWLVLAHVPSAAALSLLDPFNVSNVFDEGGVQSGADIAYAQGARHTLDVYTPQNLKKPAPVVVFYYGGAWKQGTKADYRYIGYALAARGFVVVVPDYRLVPEARYPDFLEDNAAAVKWVEDNIHLYGGDPDRTFLMGHSAGAYNAVMLGMDRAYLDQAGVGIPIRGVAALSGPYAVYPFEFQELRDAFAGVDNPQATQPINLDTSAAVPMFFGHGSIDFIVSPSNSELLAQKFEKEGRGVTLRIYEGLGHMEPVMAFSSLLRWRSPVIADVVAFFSDNGAFAPKRLGPLDLVSGIDKQRQGAPKFTPIPAQDPLAVPSQ